MSVAKCQSRVPRWQRQPEIRPQQILEAAFRVFGTRGLHQATLDDVARAAGITKGTIYLYFPGKAALFSAMLKARVNDLLPPVTAPHGARVRSTHRQLLTLARRLYRFFQTPAFLAMYRTMVGEASQFPEAAALLYREGILPANRRLADLILRGIVAGEFRRVNPLPYKNVYTILDGVRGWGQYVGTYLAWGVNNTGWWGEGEIKFFLDGDGEFPTICGTGTEDYFCGSYGFENPKTKQYQEYTTPYAGLAQVIRPDGQYESQQRFGLYRWHIMDPVRFESDLKVTIQALGWRSGGRYLPQQDDIASVAFWYQKEPHAPFPKLPDKDHLEIE